MYVVECTPGTYGDGCKQTCVGNCLEDEVCSPFDGTCPKGCAAGWKNVHPCNQGKSTSWISATHLIKAIILSPGG